MNPKEGYKMLRVYIPKPHYDMLLQRKLIHGQSMSESVAEALEKRRE